MVKRLDESTIESLRETEGVVYGLYKYLWMKDTRGMSCDVNIPHTLVYCDSMPVSWYFTSSKENRILRKKRDKLEGKQIADAFMTKRDPNITTCSWFSGHMTQFTAKQKKKDAPSIQDDDREKTIESLKMKHLPFERTQELLDPSMYRARKEQFYDGLLQKFVEPREPFDHMIRATWSPTGAVYEKRTNRFSLGASTEPMERKVALFGHDTWLNQHSFILSEALMKQLERICEDVVDHLKSVSMNSVVVAKMELFFKIDVHNKIWLLYCHNLMLDKDAMKIAAAPKPSPLANVVAASLTKLYKKSQTTLMDPLKEKEPEPIPYDPRPFMCCMTGQEHPGDQRIEVTYKLLIQHWFMLATQLKNETDRIHAVDTIPPSLRRANPSMTREYYLRHRASPSFQLTTAMVSPEAARELARASLEDLAGSLSQPLGLPLGTKRAMSAPSGQRRLGSASRPLVKKFNSPPRAARPQTTPGSSRKAPLQAPPQQTKIYNTAPRPSVPSMLMPKPNSVSTAAPGTSSTPHGDPSHALGTIQENESMHGERSRYWSPRGLSERSNSPYRSPSRNPVQPLSVGGPGSSAEWEGPLSPQSQVVQQQERPGSYMSHVDRYGPGPGSTHSQASSVAGSVRSKSLRSTGVLSNDDMRTLKELNIACGQAEQITQALLAEAQYLLQSEPGLQGWSSGGAWTSTSAPPSKPQVPRPSSGSRVSHPSLDPPVHGGGGGGGGGGLSTMGSRRGSGTGSATAGGGSRPASLSGRLSGGLGSQHLSRNSSGTPPALLDTPGAVGGSGIGQEVSMLLADDPSAALTKDEAALLTEALEGADD